MVIPIKVVCGNGCPTGLPDMQVTIAIVIGLLAVFEAARRVGGNYV